VPPLLAPPLVVLPTCEPPELEPPIAGVPAVEEAVLPPLFEPPVPVFLTLEPPVVVLDPRLAPPLPPTRLKLLLFAAPPFARMVPPTALVELSRASEAAWSSEFPEQPDVETHITRKLKTVRLIIECSFNCSKAYC
jgi:hypothetical protein